MIRFRGRRPRRPVLPPSTWRVPRHLGNSEQPKNSVPLDRLARRTIDEPQFGHSMAIK
jgi:hypothetical protein